MKKCEYTRRHFEEKQDVHGNEDVNLQFYCQLFDTLHFFVYHCFDCGFRVQPRPHLNDFNKNEEEKAMFVDAEFDRIAQVIRKTDLLTEPFERISPQSDSKFNLKVDADADADESDTTAMDQLFEHMNDGQMDNKKMQKMKTFVNNEHFDSESLLNEDGIAHIHDKECKQAIREFIKIIKSKSSNFSIGHRFYYWKYYHDKTTLPVEQQMITGTNLDNTHYHSGVSVCALCVR